MKKEVKKIYETKIEKAEKAIEATTAYVENCKKAGKSAKAIKRAKRILSRRKVSADNLRNKLLQLANRPEKKAA